MKTNGVKRKSTSMHIERSSKKTKVAKISIGHTPAVEVIDLSDSEESSNSSQQEKCIDKYKVNQKHNEQKNSRSNFSEVDGTFINQLLQLGGNITFEEVDIQDNPNEIFLSEDFDLDETDIIVATTEQATESEESNKFTGISKLVRSRCSLCKINFEKINDNQLRYFRNCPKCESPLLFQCRECASFYKYFQSVWDHVKRFCKKMEISPSIRELALKAPNLRADYNDLSHKKSSTSNQTPPMIILDSDDDDEHKANFVNFTSTLPFRIHSVESRSGGKNFEPATIDDTSKDPNDDVASTSEQDANSRDIDTEENVSSDYPTEDNEAEIKGFTSSFVPRNFEHGGVYYQCYKCEFKAESAKEIQRHIAYAHYERYTTNGYAVCSKCKRHFKSLDLKVQHEAQCCGRVYYKCKFCPRSVQGLSALKKHLVKHSKLYEEHEYDGIITEIKYKRKAAKEMLRNVFKEKAMLNDCEQSKNSDVVKIGHVSNSDPIVSEIEMNIDKKLTNFSNINELLKIRCCKCKVTFEKVEKKMILRCPNCQSELLYSCRLCNKLFAFFDKAWLHVSYECKSTQNQNSINTQSPKKDSKAATVLKQSRSTHDCRYCNYKGMHKWQLSQHMEMWHSTLNNDLDINLTACSRCGRVFDKLEKCMVHEKLHCGNDMLLVCEFCPRAEARTEPMRIHLAKVHIQQLGSLSNLEKVMDVIKMKRLTTRSVGALRVPNQREDFTKVLKC